MQATTQPTREQLNAGVALIASRAAYYVALENARDAAAVYACNALEAYYAALDVLDAANRALAADRAEVVKV